VDLEIVAGVSEVLVASFFVNEIRRVGYSFPLFFRNRKLNIQ
jgi:hypothetical protein